jgi:hypothetical protein
MRIHTYVEAFFFVDLKVGVLISIMFSGCGALTPRLITFEGEVRFHV